MIIGPNWAKTKEIRENEDNPWKAGEMRIDKEREKQYDIHV